jgi:hypothetical protein
MKESMNLKTDLGREEKVRENNEPQEPEDNFGISPPGNYRPVRREKGTENSI